MVPEDKKGYAGIVVSLSRFEYPDMSVFNDPEVVWKIDKPWHVGMIVATDKYDNVRAKLDEYTQRISTDFHASAPAPEKSL